MRWGPLSMVLKRTLNPSLIFSRIPLDFLPQSSPMKGRAQVRFEGRCTPNPSLPRYIQQLWLQVPWIVRILRGELSFRDPKSFLRCPLPHLRGQGEGHRSSQACCLPWPSTLPRRPLRGEVGGAPLPLDQAGFLRIPSAALVHVLSPFLPLRVLAPMGSEARPFYFQRPAAPMLARWPLGEKATLGVG